MPQDSIPKMCVSCGAAAQMMCARCDDSYCSVDCQKKDWARHRPMCFKMPMLVSDLEFLEQKMTTMSLTPSKSPPEDEVSTLPSDLISKQIEKAAAGYSKPSSKLVHQKLWDGLPKSTVKSNGTSNLSVEPLEQKDQPLMMSDLKKRRYPRSKIVKVKMQGMLERNVMRLVEDTKEVEEYIKRIESAVQKYSQGKLRSPSYKPVKDEVVLSFYDGGWFRACVLDPQEDGCIIQHIEYGNKETVAPGELLPASHELAFDIYARDYIIDNIPMIYNNKQKEILLSANFTITDIHLGPDASLHCRISGF